MSNFPHQLRWFTAALVGAAAFAALLLGLIEPGPPVLPLALFVALEVFSEHRAVRLSDGTLASAGFMVDMAAIVVFVGSGSVLGPFLVGASSGLYLDHFRSGRRGWIALNAATIGLATTAAALTYRVTPESVTGHMPTALLAALPPMIVFVAVNGTILAASYAVERSRTIRDVAGSLGPATVQQIPFAILGLFLGRLYLDVGPAVVLLLVVPILVAREMFASYLRVKEANEATVRVLIQALEAKDRYTAGHAERVARFARYAGEELKLMPARLERLRFAALMHDIGKLVVPNHLLNKPGKLTAEEYATVRAHESVSVEMLSRIDFLAPLAVASAGDHSAVDVEDPSRPVEPRIVSVADAFDAMTSTRSYRKALTQEVAFAELRDKSGTQFNTKCVDALIAAIERRAERYGAGFEETEHEWAVAPPEAGLGSAGLGDLAASSEVVAS